MRHRVAGRKLGRTSEHRLAMMRNLSTSLLDKERITTTLAKAKELRRFAEKLVTLSKKETLHARRQVLRHVHDREVVAKLFDTLSARYAQRPGGYTRVIKLGPRKGDNAEMAMIELVGSEGDTGTKTRKKSTKGAKGGGKPKKAADDAAGEGEGKGKSKDKKTKAPAKTAAPKKSASSASKKSSARSANTKRSGSS